ncbi:MAG: arsenical pump-driving ATPase, partial [Desulfobacterales bacterium]|nr:arsenical pump-driving ATPase [Desulfobacterales bacterium]
RGATCLGPASGMKQQHERYASSLSVLSDKKRTTLVLVSRADEIALNEAARSGQELREQGITNQHLVINGVFRAVNQDDPIAQAFQQRNERALASRADFLAELPQSHIRLHGHNIVGLDALRNLFLVEEISADLPVSTQKTALPEDLQPLASLIDDLAQAEKGLIMVMGKGGVGKTTIAAAVAHELASRGFQVHLSTTDPAAHIEQVIDTDIDGLEISRIDPKQEAEAYTQYVLSTKGKDLDADGLALLEEDLRSPCTEEVAVFRAFSRTVSKARSGFVVLDTAPTGHTLLLMDTAGAYHREVERSSAASEASFVTPMMRLQNPEFTKILITTLAETTPVSEAEKLQQDLARADI